MIDISQGVRLGLRGKESCPFDKEIFTFKRLAMGGSTLSKWSCLEREAFS